MTTTARKQQTAQWQAIDNRSRIHETRSQSPHDINICNRDFPADSADNWRAPGPPSRVDTVVASEGASASRPQSSYLFLDSDTSIPAPAIVSSMWDAGLVWELFNM